MAHTWKGELMECTGAVALSGAAQFTNAYARLPGENTDEDCRNSCQVVICPCHGFADNYRRAFSSWYIPHLLFFITFTSIWFWVSVGGYVRCAPLKSQYPLPPPGMGVGKYYNISYPPPPSNVTNVTNGTAVALAPGPSPAPLSNASLAARAARMSYNGAIDTAVAQHAAWQACNAQSNRAIGGTIVLLFTLLVYGGVRRIAMRKKFNLPGKALDDVCAWIFCAWAALCQETRTLRHNAVLQGVWQGYQAVEKTRLTAPGAVEMGRPGTAV